MIFDQFERPLGSVRISVTDRCNLRCQYCMPAAAYSWLPNDSLLDFGEIERLVRIFAGLGVSKIRLTGGEPLLRPGLPELVSRLAAVSGIAELALTTNGTKLAGMAAGLRSAGLTRLTVSLDTLSPEAMLSLNRHGRLADVLAGLDAATAAGFTGTKLNTVVMRGINDDQLGAIVRFAAERGIEPRFIEYMDVGGASEWRGELVVASREIVADLAEQFGGAEPLGRGRDPHAPAVRWQLAGGPIFGVVASTTEPFCGACDRARLTADGAWYTCLYAEAGVDLRGPLRSGESDAAIAALVESRWRGRTDRGAEERLGLPDRGALVSIGRLRGDPHLEMHVRGG